MLLVYLKRRCYPLFSSKFLIGQLYSNWLGSSSRTVIFRELDSYTVTMLCGPLVSVVQELEYTENLFWLITISNVFLTAKWKSFL